MQKPEQDVVTETRDIETVEIEQEDEKPPRSPWFYVIWAAVILIIIGFAIFGITTLMHIPPTVEPDTGFISSLLAL